MFRRRIIYYAAIVVIVIIMASGPVQALPAQWVLTPLWSDVTPGRVTVEPWEAVSGTADESAAGMLIATEDRWIRRRNAAGDVTAAVRSGLREPAGLLREGSHQALLIPNRAGSASFVRIDHAAGGVQTVGQPVGHSSAIPRDARFAVIDGESLIYSVSASGRITHASASGGILWQRRLPATPTAAEE